LFSESHTSLPLTVLGLHLNTRVSPGVEFLIKINVIYVSKVTGVLAVFFTEPRFRRDPDDYLASLHLPVVVGTTQIVL